MKVLKTHRSAQECTGVHIPHATLQWGTQDYDEFVEDPKMLIFGIILPTVLPQVAHLLQFCP